MPPRLLPRLLPLRRSLRLLPSANALSLGSLRAAGLQLSKHMKTLRIHLSVNNQPVIIRMTNPKVSRKQFPSDAYGQAPINRLLIANDTQVACVSVDTSLDWRWLRSLADLYRRKKPEALRLGGPILAIHYIKAGRGWPNDGQSEPTSIFNCLPDDQWPLLASKPLLGDRHPLLHQPPGTIAFQGLMSSGRPVVINYDSIAKVVEFETQLHIHIKQEATTELLGCAIIELRDAAKTAALADGLRRRQVKRICRNTWVTESVLYPKPERCTGHERGITNDDQWCIRHGLKGLWHNAMHHHPETVRMALCEWGAA